MTARILIVDDISVNLKLLEAKLTAEYFNIITAKSGYEALEIVQHTVPDLILLDVMMPGIDGFEVCKRLKSNPETQHIPVVMVTALDQPKDRIKGLEAGADDFLSKPTNDVALLARVKSLIRLKTVSDEIRYRIKSNPNTFGKDMPTIKELENYSSKILVIDDNHESIATIKEVINDKHQVDILENAHEAIFQASENKYDLIVISLLLKSYDGLRLVANLRSVERTRYIPILTIIESSDNQRLIKGLDLGVNDYILVPIEANEFKARAGTQLKRKRYDDLLKQEFQHNLELAVTDPLTSLNNRRFLEKHMETLVDDCAKRGKPLTTIMMDIDHFKNVNDNYGHDVGDEVLIEFAKRIKKEIRTMDLLCRFGGEEFVLVLPYTDIKDAFEVAERIRLIISDNPFKVKTEKGELTVTISAGLGSLDTARDTSDDILKRADEALYQAKRDGRNQVKIEVAA